MAFTQEQEARLMELLAAYENGKRINELEASEGLTGATLVEVMDSNGETRRMELEAAVAEAGNPIAGRWWDESVATTKAGGWFGSLEALRRLPATLGLGRYLVADDRTMRKLDPTDSRRFEDGSPAALDGTMGQCMWCWSRPWYFTHWREGNRSYYAITLKPLEGRKGYRIPAGGVSWLGAGVMDKTEMKLCSVISDDERHRGGEGTALALADRAKHPAPDTRQATMEGMAATMLSAEDFSKYARKRGKGWEANWFVAQAAVEILLLVIMGERNTQAPFTAEPDEDGLWQGGFGAGVTDMTDWSGYNGCYPLIPTSVGLETGDGTGLVDYALPASEASADGGTAYRTFRVPVFFGLVHAGYGHLWRMTSGLRVMFDKTEGQYDVYIAPDMYEAEGTDGIEGMVKVAECARNDGYIKTKSWEGLCGIPTATGGSRSTYYSDWYWTPYESGMMVSSRGGRSNDDGYNGAFSVNLMRTTKGSSAWTSPLCFFTENPLIEG